MQGKQGRSSLYSSRHLQSSQLQRFNTQHDTTQLLPSHLESIQFSSPMSTGNSAAAPDRRPVRAPEKSSFAQTCNLLSQYLKEKRTLGIGTSTTPRIEPKDEARPPATMNLLTNMENPISGEAVEPPSAAPMTIFYGGQVLVFNDLPPERAEEIMAMAAKKTETVAAKPQPPTKFLNDMPIAGRASLHRFFEKRKDRIAAAAPYQVNSGSSKTAGEGHRFNIGHREEANQQTSNHFDLNL